MAIDDADADASGQETEDAALHRVVAALTDVGAPTDTLAMPAPITSTLSTDVGANRGTLAVAETIFVAVAETAAASVGCERDDDTTTFAAMTDDGVATDPLAVAVSITLTASVADGVRRLDDSVAEVMFDAAADAERDGADAAEDSETVTVAVLDDVGSSTALFRVSLAST